MFLQGLQRATEAYQDFLEANDLSQRIKHILDQLDVDDVSALAIAGKTIRTWLIDAGATGSVIRSYFNCL